MAPEVTIVSLRSRDLVLWSGEAVSLRGALEMAAARRANLTGADLTDANLRGANLTDANLRGANLTGADLTDANLTGANLTDANLTDANLTGANLTGADLAGADLDPIRDDLFAVLSAAPTEVKALITALKAGRVDGSTYEGGCACLIGTIANARGCEYTELGPILRANSARPIERFFLAIKKGDTPDTNDQCRLVLAWSETWLSRMQAAFGPVAQLKPTVTP